MFELFLKILVCFAACSIPAVAAKADSLPVVSTNRPNVIFIKTDDQRFDSLSMTGHPVTKTPNIDQLAAEGVFFRQAFITSPICGPSRANFFTAQWERTNQVGFSSVSRNFIPEATFDNSWLVQLKSAGYCSGYIGKHHTSIGEIKDRNRYMKESLDFCYMKSGHLGFDLLTRKEFSNLKNSSQIEGLLEATEAFIGTGNDKDYFFANAGVSVKDFLKKRDPNKPFCLSINFNLPHAASIGGMGKKPTDPEMYRTLYNDRQKEFVFPEGYPDIEVPLPDEVFRQDELMGYYRTTNQRKLLSKKTKMARAVTGIDLFVGNLRKQLAEMKLADNTILVFMSDHGLLLGEHGLGGKTFLYEESIHVPLIIHSPFFGEREQGKVVDELVVGQDVPATILELCGLPVPKTYQGESLVPLINGEKVAWRKEVFCENLFTSQGYPRMEAVRGVQWKYIRYFSKENDRGRYLPEASVNGEQPIYEELFDLKADPKEQSNLAKLPEHNQVLERYRTRCQELVSELCVVQQPVSVQSEPGKLKIYYIRHAEAGHNVKADWQRRKVPEDQWPAYVGDPNVFTPKGLVQQAAVAAKLKKYHFDFIASSPMWRCQNTILPYMKETKSKGEIWPELREGRASALILDASLPAPTDPVLGAGKPIEVGAEEARYFSLRKDGKKGFKVPRAGKGRAADERSSAAARVVIQRVLDMVQTRFGGTDKSILFAGHGSSGKSVLRMLTKDPLAGVEGISNTGIWMVEQQADGTFKLMMFNDQPVVNGKPASASPSKYASMDVDKDGLVTKAEYVAKYLGNFGSKDKNKDGFLTSDEHAHSSFAKADKDKNGQLTREEFSTIFERQFDNTYDKDGDGVATVSEMR